MAIITELALFPRPHIQESLPCIYVESVLAPLLLRENGKNLRLDGCVARISQGIFEWDAQERVDLVRDARGLLCGRDIAAKSVAAGGGE